MSGATEGNCKGTCRCHPHTPGLGRFNKHKNVHNVVELQNESDLSTFPHISFPPVFFLPHEGGTAARAGALFIFSELNFFSALL